jgi:hypothetical protein
MPSAPRLSANVSPWAAISQPRKLEVPQSTTTTVPRAPRDEFSAGINAPLLGASVRQSAALISLAARGIFMNQGRKPRDMKAIGVSDPVRLRSHDRLVLQTAPAARDVPP